MKLILKETVDKLGVQGDVIDVKSGYARNYLIPQGLADIASESNLKKVEEEKLRNEEDAKKYYLEVQDQAVQLEGISLTFKVRAGDDGKLFGSVTNSDIADRLNQGNLNFEVDRRNIILDEPLKLLGEFKVPIRLHNQIEVEIEVCLEEEESG
tara:strand:+ start:3498 stop:3956 length:459 start_codon:yes stop_codon:yes gene_type:complete